MHSIQESILFWQSNALVFLRRKPFLFLDSQYLDMILAFIYLPFTYTWNCFSFLFREQIRRKRIL